MKIKSEKQVSNKNNESNHQQCEQCYIKSQLNLGINKKCFIHQIQQKDQQIGHKQISFYEEIMINILDIQELTSQYVQTHLNQHQIQQIVDSLRKVIKKLQIGKIQSLKNVTNLQLLEQLNQPGLYHYINQQQTIQIRQSKISFNHQAEQSLIKQYVTKWLGYFSQKLTLLNSNKMKLLKKDTTIILPLQEYDEVLILRHKIEGQLNKLVQNIEHKEKLFNQVIDKLVFYIDLQNKSQKNDKNPIKSYDKNAIKSYQSLYSLDRSCQIQQRNVRKLNTSRKKPQSKSKYLQKTSDSQKSHSISININPFTLDMGSSLQHLEQDLQRDRNCDQTFRIMLMQAEFIQELSKSSTISIRN